MEGDFGDAFHHDLRAAGEKDGAAASEGPGVGEVGAQVGFEGLGDVAFVAVSSVVGGDDGWDAVPGELAEVVEGVDGSGGFRGRGVARDRQREEVLGLGAAEGDDLRAGEGLGEVNHRRDPDAAADEQDGLVWVGGRERIAKRAEDVERVGGAEGVEVRRAGADDALDEFEDGRGVWLVVAGRDGEGAAEEGGAGERVGEGGGGEATLRPSEFVVGEVEIGVAAEDLEEVSWAGGGEEGKMDAEEGMFAAKGPVFEDCCSEDAARGGGGGGGHG